MSEQNEQPERWHLKKEIQITHVFTTLALVGAVFAYVQKVDQRLTIVETQLVAQREASVIQRAQLERMDAKLDRLIERSK
jgi:hypothetical protein